MRLKFTTVMPLDIGDATNAFTLVALGLTYQGNFVEYIFSNKSTQTFQFMVSYILRMFFTSYFHLPAVKNG